MAMSRLSVSSCRASRARPAPMAARTAISRWRVAARDSRRFETLTQAMSSSRPTAANRIHSVSRRSLGNVSLNESRPDPPAAIRKLCRLALRQVRDNRAQIGLGLRLGHAGLQPAEHVHVR